MGNRPLRRVPRPTWLPRQASWPRVGHRAGSPVRGWIPGPVTLALVGEGPGKDESRYGYPFVGASGQEVDRHLRRVGLDRRDVAVSNVSWQLPPKKGVLGSPNPHLWTELAQANPTVLMPLGAHAARTFLGEDLTMEEVHGIPYRWTAPWDGADRIVLPGYHPAAGMHQVELSAHVAYDFDVLRGVLAGEIPIREAVADAGDAPEYIDASGGPFSDFHALRPTILGIDTEGSIGDPSMISLSPEPRLAYVLRLAEDAGALASLIDYFTDEETQAHPPLVFLHNALHDLPVLAAMGIDLVGWGIPFLDTMILAYQLCVEPQGLKALALRHAGMRMTSYTELVGPYTWQRAVDYLVQVANDHTLPMLPSYTDAPITKDGRRDVKLHRVTPVYKRAEKILMDVAIGKRDKDGELPDPLKRWSQVDAPSRAVAEARYGMLAEAPLTAVPLRLSVPYAAADADATRRIGPILLARHRAVFGEGRAA